MKSKVQLNWEVGKECQERFIKSLFAHTVILDDSEIRELFTQIRQNEYRRGKEDALNKKALTQEQEKKDD